MRFALCLLLALGFTSRNHAASTTMIAWSGSDGPFTNTNISGYTVHQANDGGGGDWSGFMYFQRPVGVNFGTGVPLYMEVDFLDLGGPGSFSVQYNAVGNAFQGGNYGFNRGIYTSGAFKTAVFKIDNTAFSYAENGGNDLRLTKNGNPRMHIIEVRVSDTPTAAYLAATAFMGPYSGPTL